MEAFMPQPKGYTRTQIGLHWLIAVLVLIQFLQGENLSHAFRRIMGGQNVSLDILALSHVWLGVALLALVVVRIGLRLVYGAPPQPADEPDWMKFSAHAMHVALYALILLVPFTGAMSWFLGQRLAGDVHEVLQNLLEFLAILHIAAALFQHFVMKSDVLNRMRKPAA
jgi:cytochrome b561